MERHTNKLMEKKKLQSFFVVSFVFSRGEFVILKIGIVLNSE